MVTRLLSKIAVLSVASFGVFVVRGEKTPLETKIAQKHRIIESDGWGGGHRIIFDFGGRRGWIVEPMTAREDRPWCWTMQWMGAFLNRTGAPDLVKRGFFHVHLEAFDTRADDEGLKVLAAFQSYLVDGLGFAKKANLIGMSWGGFYSIRYASEHPENVSRIYLDAPLLNVYTLEKKSAKVSAERIGSWAKSEPADPANDPRMAVNRAAAVARAKIPILLLYGKSDDVVDPSRNCEPFLKAFRAAGGSVAVEARDAWGHHPHGLDEDEVGRIVEFFEASAHPGDRASFGPLSPSARPYERQYLWPEERMPDFQPHQIAAKWGETKKRDFDRAANRKPFIEWYAPAGSNKTDICVLTISGGRRTDSAQYQTGTATVAVGGKFEVRDTAKFRPNSDGYAGGSVQVTVGGRFTLSASACVDADRFGYGIGNSGSGSGYGDQGRRAASHGGYGTTTEHPETAPYVLYGAPYDYKYAPREPGQTSRHAARGLVRGGGAIRIVAESMKIDGRLTADGGVIDGVPPDSGAGGASSGGTIWLAANHGISMGAGVSLSARGASSAINPSVGASGGGRIAICERLTDAQYAALLAKPGTLPAGVTDDSEAYLADHAAFADAVAPGDAVRDLTACWGTFVHLTGTAKIPMGFMLLLK